MNKKVVLSVLSTTLVASLAASAFAAPKDGIYIGGDIKKFYSTDVLFEMTPAAKTAYNNELKTMATNLNNVVFVDYKGNGASLQEMFDKGGKVALGEPLKKEDFADLYKVVNKDGSSTATENARDKVDGTTPGDLKVESVSAINAKEIKVVYGTKVLKDSAETSANYTVTLPVGLTAGTPVLQDDEKSVIIPISGGTLAAGGSYKVNVKNVLDTKYNKIVDFTDTLKLFSDSTPPTVVKAELKANKVRVYFNEPVIATGLSVKVDGVAVAGPYVASTTAGVYYIETPVITNTSLLSAGTHNVTVYDATDAVSGAGNKASILTTSYAVSTDTVAPSVVSVTAKDAYTFKVKFSEPLAAEPGTVTVKKGVVTLPLDNTLDAGGNGIALDTTDTSNTTYLVKVKDVDANNKVYATGEASVNLSVTVSNYKDSADLIGSQFSGSVTLTKDAVAPKVLSAALNTINAGTKTINVKFDEALDTVVTPSLITVKKDGVIIPVVSAVRNADTKSVDIVLNAGHTVTVGTYVVDFAAGAVKDASLNPNADLSTTVAYETAATALVIAPDTDGTVGAGGAGIESGEANVITVNYGEEMLDGAATLSNYKLDGTAFPAGTTIGFIGDKSKVKITLPAGYFAVNTTARVLISTDVKAKSGKVVAANVNPLTANEFNLNFTDNVKPTLAGAKFLVSSMSAPTTNKIELNFSENLGAVNSNAATIADFNVTVNGVKATIASLTDGTAGDSKVVLQTADAINLSQPVVLTVVPVGTDNVAVDVTDVAGNKLTTETTLSVTDKVIDTDAIGNDAVAAANVNAQINALPTAAAAVASDKANVDAAKTAYEALSANAKAQVTPANVTKLNDLVAKMADFDAVLAEKALLDATPKAITLNGDVDQTNLNTNIAKPSITTAGVVATWTNSSDASITVAGGNASQVSRPANGAGSATVTLELTLTKGTASVTVDYTVTVEEDTTA